MNTELTKLLSTKEGFLAFLRAHPARLLFSSPPEDDGSVYHSYDVEGLPKGVLHGANMKACLSPDGADFTVPFYGPNRDTTLWWVYTPTELGLHPAACTMLLAVGADAMELLHLPQVAPAEFSVPGFLFQA